jgi:hypothetical protein
MPKEKEEQNSTEVYWTKKAQEFLLGRKIVSLGYVPSDFADECYYNSRGLWFVLDNGSEVFVMSDDEGNDGGSLHIYANKKTEVLPTL